VFYVAKHVYFGDDVQLTANTWNAHERTKYDILLIQICLFVISYMIRFIY